MNCSTRLLDLSIALARLSWIRAGSLPSDAWLFRTPWVWPDRVAYEVRWIAREGFLVVFVHLDPKGNVASEELDSGPTRYEALTPAIEAACRTWKELLKADSEERVAAARNQADCNRRCDLGVEAWPAGGLPAEVFRIKRAKLN